jgi:hypothetical protein
MDYQLDFGKVSFAQLKEKGVLEGTRRKVFLFVDEVSYTSYTNEESRITRMENLLNDHNQIVVKFFVKKNQVICRKKTCAGKQMKIYHSEEKILVAMIS